MSQLSPQQPCVVAYGLGLNSTAMLIEMRRRDIVPDLILAADTKAEKPETYALAGAFNAWLIAHGFPPITFVSRHDTLEGNCLKRNALPSVAYGWKTCSQRWKMLPQEQYVNRWEPAKVAWKAGVKVKKYVGFDAGEMRRATSTGDDKYDLVYPLIDWDMWREECEQVCLSEGFTVPKSSCFFCPNMKKAEVLELSINHPDLMQRALAMESQADLQVIKGLGRRWSWADLLKAQDKACLTESATDQPCGCYDRGDE